MHYPLRMLSFTLVALLGQDAPLRLYDPVEVQARIRAWRPSVVGGMQGDEDNSTISLDEDLDVDSPLWMPLYDIRLLFRAKDGRARAGVGISGASFATSGEKTLDSDEEFEGSVFQAGTTLRSRFRFETFGIDALLAGMDDPEELIHWRFSIGLHYMEAEVRLSGAGARESEEFPDANLKFTFAGEVRPAPLIFVSGSIAAYTDVFSLLFGVDSGHYAGELEISGGLEVGPLRLEIGVRVFAWSLNWLESQIDLLGYGPFAGLTLRF